MSHGSLKSKVLFVLLFAAIALAAQQINFSALVGAQNQFFTVFQLFGPIAGAFLGPIVGVGAVLISELGNAVVFGKAWGVLDVLRLTPMLFAAYYFGTHGKKAFRNLSVAVPIIAMALFMLHPVGRQAWFFSLYWTIPIIAKFFPNNLLMKSFGATFTAHAVGGAIWVWTVPMTAQQWVALIPVVAYERTVFALGIAVSFVAMTTVLAKLDALAGSKVSGAVTIEKKYDLALALKSFLKARA